MIVYLYGGDSYRRGERLKELIEMYKKRYKPIDTAVFDLEEEPDAWIRIRDFLNQPSIFFSFKLAVIKEGGQKEEEEWAKTLKSQLKTEEIVVLISDKEPPKKTLMFLLEKPVRSQAFLELKGVPLFEFLKEESWRRKLSFSYNAWRLFCSYIVNSLEKSYLAVNELEKVSLASFRQPISSDDLQDLIRFKRKEVPYLAAQEMLRVRDPVKKLVALEKVLLQKEAPAYIFNSLSYQVRGPTALCFADYDVSVKSGELEYEEVLTDFCLRV